MANDLKLLTLNGVSAYYGRVRALEEINLDIAHGECVAILGANGAGKTSLLRLISGILVRRVGRIFFDGTEIGSLPPHKIVRLGISHVPEGRHLFPPLTVAENLEIGALPLCTSGRKEEVAQARNLVFELFPCLADRTNQLAGTLSGGEQQMLAIGRTIMSRPKLLLLDEPSVGLAPKVVEDLFGVLYTLKQLGLTILLAEQNVPLALDHANKAIVLNLGQIGLSGSPTELRGNPDVRRIYLGEN